MVMAVSDNTVKARPTKAFFIEMITRDLGLTDCILDLVDNAIDHAVARAAADVMAVLTDGGKSNRLEGASIAIEFSNEEFVIRDTCGGISVDDARTKVFMFGNPDDKSTPGGLSVFGIGMKRGFFKLGHHISMLSHTANDWFSIEIDVRAWQEKGDDDWDFTLKESGTRKVGDGRGPEGTSIRITDLRNEVKERLEHTSFTKDLVARLSATYALFITSGLVITVQGVPVLAALPALGTYDKVTPARRIVERDHVQILIVAGLTSADDKIARGWYVFCNGRMILEADKSRLTGWGEGSAPQWHTKYRRFVGYAYFRSDDVRSLPWTTTKQGVVYESPVYQTALSEMAVQGRPILTFLNNVYPGEQEAEGVPERELLAQVRSVPITQVPRQQSIFKVDLEELKRNQENVLMNVQYKKSVKELERVRRCLKSPGLPATKIGEYTFDYFVKQECE